MIRSLHLFLSLLFCVSALRANHAHATEDDHGASSEYESEESARGSNAIPEPDQVAEAKTADADRAPERIKNLRSRTVGSYFLVGSVAPALHERAVATLLKDCNDLWIYFERDHADPYIERATLAGLEKFVRRQSFHRTKTHELTLEQVLARESTRAMMRGKNPWEHLTALMGVRHFRGGTAATSMQLVRGLFKWIGRQFTPERDLTWKAIKPVAKIVVPIAATVAGVDYFTHSHTLTAFLFGSIWGTVQAGPLATLLKASTDWFLQPTTEFVTTWSNGRTGNAKQKIHIFYSEWKQELNGAQGLDEVREATLEEDDSNMAGLSGKAQRRVFRWAQTVFIEIVNAYDRINTKTQHHGRALLTSLWSDELDTVNMVLRSRAEKRQIDSDVMIILNPYRDVLVTNGDHARNNDLANQYYDMVDAIEGHDWVKDGSTESLRTRINEFETFLRDLHVPEVEIKKIIALQEERSVLTNSIVTTLAVNEVRYHFFPEANRNMASRAREIQRSIRRNFGIQYYVAKYQSQINDIQRAMGLPIDDEDEDGCNDILVHPADGGAERPAAA